MVGRSPNRQRRENRILLAIAAGLMIYVLVFGAMAPGRIAFVPWIAGIMAALHAVLHAKAVLELRPRAGGGTDAVSEREDVGPCLTHLHMSLIWAFLFALALVAG